jgi:hypothetical protein
VEGAANAASVMTSATRISNYCSGWDQECYLPGAWTLTHLTAPRSSCSLRRRCPLEVSLHLQGRPAGGLRPPSAGNSKGDNITAYKSVAGSPELRTDVIGHRRNLDINAWRPSPKVSKDSTRRWRNSRPSGIWERLWVPR